MAMIQYVISYVQWKCSTESSFADISRSSHLGHSGANFIKNSGLLYQRLSFVKLILERFFVTSSAEFSFYWSHLISTGFAFSKTSLTRSHVSCAIFARSVFFQYNTVFELVHRNHLKFNERILVMHFANLTPNTGARSYILGIDKFRIGPPLVFEYKRTHWSFPPTSAEDKRPLHIPPHSHHKICASQSGPKFFRKVLAFNV